MAQHVLVGAIRAYQTVMSPLLHAAFGPLGGCRYEPTCSVYALEAVQKHGAWCGGWLAVMRVCRCHPWGAGGADPVPEAHDHRGRVVRRAPAVTGRLRKIVG